jgi:hypothetical protein
MIYIYIYMQKKIKFFFNLKKKVIYIFKIYTLYTNTYILLAVGYINILET